MCAVNTKTLCLSDGSAGSERQLSERRSSAIVGDVRMLLHGVECHYFSGCFRGLSVWGIV